FSVVLGASSNGAPSRLELDAGPRSSGIRAQGCNDAKGAAGDAAPSRRDRRSNTERTYAAAFAAAIDPSQ
ncbi:hypothetical protein, partial [Bradyrhizobium sp.]|uniref:hypothetical protein n=1 Tax=Bradyrhizobium sp. TaxID=376 RepID=UPI002733120C